MPRRRTRNGPLARIGPLLRSAPAPVRAALAVLVAGVLLATTLLVPAGAVAAAVRVPGPAVPSGERAPLATVLLDAEGHPFARIYDQYRLAAATDEISPTLGEAVVAIEDRRFYEHGAVDWEGVARALLSNTLRTGNPFDGQGASTITMQYVKNLRLYAEARTPQQRAAATADTLTRKLEDVRDAAAVERRLTKQQILTRYLNTVYFGHGAYGAAAAARTYFATDAAHLTVAQSALLAALVRRPTAYDPVDHPGAARTRRNLVLADMAQTGAITPARAAAAQAAPLGIVTPLHENDPGCAAARPGTGFFCRYVVAYLARHGVDADRLRTGGYTIRTTLDPQASAAAKRAATAQVPAADPGVADAVAVVEPGRDRHAVLALAANRSFGPGTAPGQSSYALPTAAVPYGAGSVYKIFTAAAAMARGLGIHSEVPAPETYTSTHFRDGGRPYTVSGANGAPPRTTLQHALALSPNTTFVALLDRLGSVDPVVDMAHRLGMRRSLAEPAGNGQTVGEAVRAQQRASFTLGPEPTIPLDLANVAATLVSHGTWCPATPIASITDASGRRVDIGEAACAQVVSPGLADTLAVGLSKDAVYGTSAAAARSAGWHRPVLGKTGTTEQAMSAAFVGATPQIAGAVMTWSDASPPRPVCQGDPPHLCGHGNLYGGTIPARTWFATMQPLLQDQPVLPLPAPDPRYLRGTIASPQQP